MALAPGTRIGPHEIGAQVGVGGMGEVYRARDTKLDRDVAIKVLPEAFAGDAERLARFEREAKTLAALNHPGIAHIYGIEDTDGSKALVMELVPGNTLAEQIARTKPGGLPVTQALAIARQIADALDAAHEKGIVHRDLKPANVKVTPEGLVKVLDFGLAKLQPAEGGPDASQTLTATIGGTRAGVILGTAAYMSPEQARGHTVDKRTDIWAFGCVLFEMLSGRRPFAGDTLADTVASLVDRDPPWDALPSNAPTEVIRLTRRCLEKDPKRRLRDIGDARHELDLQSLSGEERSAEHAALRPVAQRMRRLVSQAAAVLLGIAAAALVAAIARVGPFASPATTWVGTALGGPNTAWVPRLSPDGRTLAFGAFVEGLPQVAVIDPRTGHWTAITKDRTRGYVSRICWSPDGSYIFYTRYRDVPRGVFSIPALGGEERLILENATGGESLPDGSLLVGRLNAARRLQLHRFWPGEGRLQPLPAIMTDPELLPVRVLPDGRRAVFWGRRLEQSDSDPAVGLHALDLTAGTVESIASGLSVSATARVGSVSLAVMPDGGSVLVSIPQGDAIQLSAVDLDGSGRIRPLHHLTHSTNEIDVGADGSIYVAQAYRTNEVWTFGVDGSQPRLLNVHDNLHLRYASVVNAIHTPAGHTWLATVVGGQPRLMTATPDADATPFIDTNEATDGPMTLVGADRIAFIIGNGEARRIAIASRADGRILRRLTDVNAATIVALAATPDGKNLFYVDAGAIWSVVLDGGTRQRIRAGDGVAVTPDGRRLVIQLTESGGVRWLTTNLDGSDEHAIAVQGEARFASAPIGPGALAPDGRIVLPVTSTSAYFWSVAILDPRTGAVTPVPTPFAGDVPFPSWTDDGRIVAVTHGLRSTLWRLAPLAP